MRCAGRSRPDVLVYRTPPLEADLTLAGPFRAALAVAITGTDADFVVKLIDVYTGDAPGTSDEGVPMGGCGERPRSPTECGATRYSAPLGAAADVVHFGTNLV